MPRRELLQDRRNELGDRRVYVHRALENGVGRLRVHRIQHAVDHFVAAGPEHGGAKNLAGVRVDDNFHQAGRLAFLDRASDARHRTFANQDGATTALRFGFRHPRAAERRVRVEGVRLNAI